MAERLIKESDVIENIDEWLEGVGYATIGKNLSYYAELKGCIADAPTIEAKPVVHAHWDDDRNCTHCGRNYMDIAITTWENFSENEADIPSWCPYCGAQMDEEVQDDG